MSSNPISVDIKGYVIPFMGVDNAAVIQEMKIKGCGSHISEKKKIEFLVRTMDK